MKQKGFKYYGDRLVKLNDELQQAYQDVQVVEYELTQKFGLKRAREIKNIFEAVFYIHAEIEHTEEEKREFLSHITDKF